MAVNSVRVIVCFYLIISANACFSSAPRNKSELSNNNGFDLERPPSLLEIANGETFLSDPQQFDRQLQEAGSRWFYGPGLGKTMFNVGTVFLLPPYGLYLLANAGLQLAGCEPLYLTDALPEGPRKGVNEVYEGLTSAPGVITSVIAGHEYYSGKLNKEVKNEG